MPNKNADNNKNDDYDISDMRLIMKGLHPDTTEEILKDHFSKYGTVVDISLHASRSFAFITFSDYKKFPLEDQHFIDGR